MGRKIRRKKEKEGNKIEKQQNRNKRRHYGLCTLLSMLEHLQKFVKIYLANTLFCQLLKSYAK
jgi:hypothetical protein